MAGNWVTCWRCGGKGHTSEFEASCCICNGDGGWREVIEEKGEYRIERREKRSSGGKVTPYWVVIRPDGEIANGYAHSNPTLAERHKAYCEAFCH